MTILTDILKQTNIYSPDDTDIDYHKSHINILLQQLKRTTNIEQNRIWDYIAVENDPNFSRRVTYTSNKLTKLMSNLSVSQQILTATQAQLYLANVYNFIPKNLTTLISSYMRLVDTTNNLLPTITQQIPFNMIEQALLHDLLSYFDNGQATYNDIVDLSGAILGNLEYFDNIKTGNLKSILSLPLSKFLPKEFSFVLESLTYLDLLDEIFTDDTEKNNFNIAVLNILQSYNSSNVSQYVSNSYEQYNVSYDDCLGLVQQQALISEFSDNLFDDIQSDLIPIYTQYQVTSEYQTSINQALQQQFQIITDLILDSNVLLPSLIDCSETIKTNSNNDVVNSIRNSFVLFQREILKRIPEIKQNSSSFDYLINIKNNLELREKYLNNNSSIDQMYEVQDYINQRLNSKLTDKQIDQLYLNIKEVLKI